MKHLIITLLTVALFAAPPIGASPARAQDIHAPQPSPAAIKQKDMGNRHFKAGRYMEAIACYTNAIDAAPSFFEAHYNRGLTWHSLGLFYKAIVDFDRALELRPNDAEVLYFRGLSYEKTGQFEEALADLQRAARKKNRLAETHLKDGELKRKVQKTTQKERALQTLADTTAQGTARTTRTTLGHNAYGGQTTTTVFSKGDPLYDGPEGIFKQINHYNKAGDIRQSDTFHHALFSAKNNRNKTVTHINEEGTTTRVEHHLTGRNLGKVTLFYYGSDGTCIKTDTVSLSKFQKMKFDGMRVEGK